MSSIRVAIIQWHIKPLAPEENYATACNYIRQAAADGAQLAVLPEYHLSGWVPDDPRWSEQAGQSTTYLENYKALARELKICLVPGTLIERQPRSNPTSEEKDFRLFNVAHFISDNGTVLGSYRKKNIWHPERPHLTSSTHERHAAIETPLGRVGLLICWDLAFPEAFRELIADGADVIIIPTFWTPHDASAECLRVNPNSEALFLESTLTARCFENTCGIIFVNAAGPKEDFLGLSQVTLPLVGPITKMGNEEGLRVVDMDLNILNMAERNYKTLWHL
ncbi:Uncharacterized protein PECH_006134 [Penicillium ucsense]|uniref:CN hydrolase domain-containing protein n=1 Tax=Penicillium ucsense TaxID=2839758 RepID=A0A8J8W4P1_9EURO|nr:Uncharacterized protein PECM_006607 [Penicillium ucsense]KAF7735781.1 Uncharacterized protein PECH_006134 [Penicillium ucsense]